MLATMFHNFFYFFYFRPVKLDIFGFDENKLIFHSHNTMRILRLCKSLKGAYTFSQKIKWIYLIVNKSEE